MPKTKIKKIKLNEPQHPNTDSLIDFFMNQLHSQDSQKDQAATLEHTQPLELQNIEVDQDEELIPTLGGERLDYQALSESVMSGPQGKDQRVPNASLHMPVLQWQKPVMLSPSVGVPFPSYFPSEIQVSWSKAVQEQSPSNQQQLKVMRRKAQNRLSAQRCRKKKVDKIITLEKESISKDKRIEDKDQENACLKQEIACMKKENINKDIEIATRNRKISSLTEENNRLKACFKLSIGELLALAHTTNQHPSENSEHTKFAGTLFSSCKASPDSEIRRSSISLSRRSMKTIYN